MKTNKLINRTLVSIFTISAGIFLSSCSKERIEPTTELNSYESMNEYFDSKKQEEQEFIIDTSGTEPIQGKEGTKIWANKEKLMYPNGDSVQWPYIVKLVELYPAKDMIYYQTPNMTNQELFLCKGEVRVRAYKDGVELVLRENETWDVELKDSNSIQDLSVFYEDKVSEPINWTESMSDQFTDTNYGYLGQISPLGWTAGGLPTSFNQTSISFTSETDDLSTVRKFIYFPEYESVIEVYNNSYTLAPKDSRAKIIIMAMDKNQNLFYFYSETNVTNSMIIDVEMKEISDAELTNILDNL